MTLREKIDRIYADYFAALAKIFETDVSIRIDRETALWEETEEKLAAVWVSHGRALH